MSEAPEADDHEQDLPYAVGCAEYGERLSALIDDELIPAEATTLALHLEGCAACRQGHDRLDRAAGLVGTLTTDPLDEAFFVRLDARMQREMYSDGLVTTDDGPWEDVGGPWKDKGEVAGRRARDAWVIPFALRLAAAALLVAGGVQLHAMWAMRTHAAREAQAQRDFDRMVLPPGAGVGPSEVGPSGVGPSEEGSAAGDGPAGERSQREERDGASDPAQPGFPPGSGARATHHDDASARERDLQSGPGEPPIETGDERSAPAGAPDSGAPPVDVPPAHVPERGSSSAVASVPEGHADTGAPASAKTPADAGASARDAKLRRAREQELARRFRSARATDDDRSAALYELAQSGGPVAIATLREVCVRRPARYGRLVREAIDALGAYPSPEGIDILVYAARHRPVGVRAALTRIDQPELLTHLRDAVLPELAEAQHPDARLLVAERLATSGLYRVGLAIVEALEATREASSRVRLLRALGAVAGAPAREALLASLRDRLAPIRAAAARSLGELDANDRIGAALLAAAKGDSKPAVRVAATTALGQHPGVDRFSELAALRAGDTSGAVRGAAQFALMRLTGEGLFAPEDWNEAAARRERTERSDSGGPEPLATRGPIGACVIVPSTAVPESYHGIPVLSDGVCFLVDISDSMRHEGKLERAQRELARTLEALPAGTRFTVGVFSDRVAFAFHKGLVRRTDKSVRDAQAFVAAQRATGGRTDLGRAIQRGLAIRGVDQLFLLTDGAPTAGDPAAALLESVRGWTWDQSVRIHVIGLYKGDAAFRVDDPEDPTLPAPGPIGCMRELVRIAGGVFVRNDR